MKTLSLELQNRVKRELEHTQNLLNKELRFPQDLRNQEIISFYENHLLKLNNML